MSVTEQNIGTEYNAADISVVNDEVADFNGFLLIGKDKTISNQMDMTGLPGFTKMDETTYGIKLDALGVENLSGGMGIYYDYQSGKNKTVVYADGQEYQTIEFKFDYDSSVTRIDVISTDCTVEDEIKIIFTTKEQADAFQGIIFSWH